MRPNVSSSWGLAGVAGAAVVATGVFASYSGDPNYSPLEMFVSELGRAATNPLAERFNRGFIAGGSLLALFFAALTRGAEGMLRAACVLAAICGAALCAVGLLPLPSFAPHNTAAGVCAFSALAASLCFARAAGSQQPSWVSWSSRAFAALLTLCFVGAFGFVAVRALQSPYGLDELLDRLSWLLDVEIAGRLVNPVAVSEWCVFTSSLVFLCGISVAVSAQRVSPDRVSYITPSTAARRVDRGPGA